MTGIDGTDFLRFRKTRKRSTTTTSEPTKRRSQGLPRTAASQPRTHCPAGHEFTEANTYFSPSRPNARRCRTCISEQHRARRERQEHVLEPHQSRSEPDAPQT